MEEAQQHRDCGAGGYSSLKGIRVPGGLNQVSKSLSFQLLYEINEKYETFHRELLSSQVGIWESFSEYESVRTSNLTSMCSEVSENILDWNQIPILSLY